MLHGRSKFLREICQKHVCKGNDLYPYVPQGLSVISHKNLAFLPDHNGKI